MLKESFKIHGARQFELKQRIDFPKDAKDVRYSVDTFFFLPSALQINAETLTKNEFLRSVKCYVRLRAQNSSLKAMLAPCGSLEEIEQIIDSSEAGLTQKDFENHMRRFAIGFRRAARKAVRNVQAQKETSLKSITLLLTRLSQITMRWRALKPKALELEKRLHSGAWQYCDEYLTFELAACYKKLYQAVPDTLKAQVAMVWQAECAYGANTYPTSELIGETRDTAFLLRWSALKKYVCSLLFLEMKPRHGSPLMIHTLYGLAAAFAMLFATAVAFLWQGKYGSLSMNLFVAMVIAYIFKDRLKEITRDWLAQVFRRWIPDRRTDILTSNGQKVGLCQESFGFAKQKDIPEFVRVLRDNSHWIQLLNDSRADTVFRWTKKMRIQCQGSLCEHASHALIDIVRLNVSTFLKNLDDRFEELPVWDETDELHLAEKLYFIYVLRVVTHAGKKETSVLRVVVNADGLKRVIPIKSYSEDWQESPKVDAPPDDPATA